MYSWFSSRGNWSSHYNQLLTIKLPNSSSFYLTSCLRLRHNVGLSQWRHNDSRWWGLYVWHLIGLPPISALIYVVVVWLITKRPPSVRMSRSFYSCSCSCADLFIHAHAQILYSCSCADPFFMLMCGSILRAHVRFYFLWNLIIHYSVLLNVILSLYLNYCLLVKSLQCDVSILWCHYYVINLVCRPCQFNIQWAGYMRNRISHDSWQPTTSQSNAFLDCDVISCQGNALITYNVAIYRFLR